MLVEPLLPFLGRLTTASLVPAGAVVRACDRMCWNGRVQSPIHDEYDRRAYELLRDELSKGPSAIRRASGRVGHGVRSAAQTVTKKLPASISDGAEQALRLAFSGLRTLTLDPAMRSVSIEKVLRSYQSAGHAVLAFDDIRELPLRSIDDVIPGLRWRYSMVAAVEGAGAGVIITGGELLATVGSVASAGAAEAPGAGAVIGAMAFDAATVLAASARVVAHTAAYYGYNVRLPEEELFALTVINWSSAASEGAKIAGFQELSRVTQLLVRGAAWAQLSEHSLVRVIQEIYARLGIRITQRKLGQAIPVAGIALGAGMNASLLNAIGRDAQLAYRSRHLADKYGFDLDELVKHRSHPQMEGGATDIVDIEGIVEAQNEVE